MTAEEQLVGQIRDFLRRYDQEKDPATEELADQYAALCRRINGRLVRCNDFLEKGMRSEAVQEAQVPPPLIELVDTANFPEVTKWRNICADLELTVFPPLRMEIVDRLREECTKEEFLSPLLHEYRRLVHQGALDDRIRILRRIREMDPENTVWEENLVPLEKEQQEELLPVARKALVARDIPQLQRLYDDLTDSRRIVEPPERLVGKIGAVLRRYREQQAREEGERLRGELEAAVAGEDLDHVHGLLKRWGRLTKFEDFHPAEDMINAATRAQRWHDTEQARRQADADFATALDELRFHLDMPLPDALQLQHSYLSAQSFNRPLPAGVEESVENARGRIKAAATRRRFRRAVATVAIVAVLIAVGGIASVFLLGTIQRRRTVRTVHALVNAGDATALRQYLDDLKREHPDLLQVTAVQQAMNDLQATVKQAEEKTAEFDQVMARLDDVRRSNYDLPGPQLQQLIDRAGRLAVTPRTQARIKGWRLAFQLWNAKRQKDLEDRFSALLARLGDTTVRMPALKAGPIEAEGKALEQARTWLGDARKLVPSVPTDLRGELDPLDKVVKEWAVDYDARVTKLRDLEARRLRTLRVMDRPLPDIAAYQELLQAFLDEFTRSPERIPLRKALGEVPMYQDAVALQGFHIAALPMSTPKLKQAQGLLKKLEGGPVPGIWAEDLRHAVVVTEAQAAIGKSLAGLAQLDFYSLHVFYIRPKGVTATEEWEPVYYPGEIFSQERKLSDGATITLYWGQAFRGDPEEKEATLQHVKFSSSEYEVKIHRRRESNLIPAAKFARELVAEATHTRNVDMLLLDAMKRLVESDTIQPVPKMVLLRLLGGLLARTIGAVEPEVVSLGSLFSDIKPDVSWLNRKNTGVTALEEKIRAEIRALPDFTALAADLQRNRKLLRLALDRRVVCAGIVKQDPDNPLKVVPALRLPHLRTAWIITVDARARQRQFLRAIEIDATEKPAFTKDVQGKTFLGQLLFVPSDGLPAAELLKTALPQLTAPVHWPDSWPINQRILPEQP